MVNTLFKPLAAIALVAATATLAQADDLFPPPWFGEPLSVHAEWDWMQPPANLGFMPPDTFDTVSGTADPNVGPNGESLYMGFNTHSEVDLPADWSWVPGDGDGGLTPNLPGLGIAFNVQNWIDFEPFKYIRIQVTYQGAPPTIDWVLGVFEPGGGQADGFPLDRFDQPGYFYEDWIIEPNPDWEQIVIGVPMGTVLDQVVIDTVSFPSPGTLALLAAVPLIITRRRR